MAYAFQVTVDSAHPHTAADWWAQTLGWEVEPSNPDFIRSMVDQGFATEEDTTLHNGTLVWKAGAALRHPDAAGGAPRVLFQLVPEPKTVKNRLHLDLRIGTDDVDAAVAQLVARGATFLHTGRQGPSAWTTMADPEGNEFCVSQSS